MLLRDGLSVGFDLDDPAAVRAAVDEAVTTALDAPTRPPEPAAH
jgi:hypothetical protein